MGRRRQPNVLSVVMRAGDREGEQYELTVLDVTEELIHWLLDRMDQTAEIKKNQRDLYCMSYGSYAVEFHDRSVVWAAIDDLLRLRATPSEALLALDDVEWGVPLILHDQVARRLFDGDSEGRVECCTAEIYDDVVHWEASVKHTNQMVFTDSLYRHHLETLLERLELF